MWHLGMGLLAISSNSKYSRLFQHYFLYGFVSDRVKREVCDTTMH